MLYSYKTNLNWETGIVQWFLTQVARVDVKSDRNKMFYYSFCLKSWTYIWQFKKWLLTLILDMLFIGGDTNAVNTDGDSCLYLATFATGSSASTSLIELVLQNGELFCKSMLVCIFLFSYVAFSKAHLLDSMQCICHEMVVQT